MKDYCVEANDRVCHNIVLFIGTKEECQKQVGNWFQHREYGGIDAVVVEYDNRTKNLEHDIH